MIITTDTDEEGCYKMWFTKEDMHRNGWMCGLIGFGFGSLCGAILTFIGLLGLAHILGIE